MRFGGEGERLQLLAVRRHVTAVAGGVRVLGVRRGRRGRRGQGGGGGGRGVQRGGRARLGKVCVREVGGGVRLREGGAGVCVCGLCERSVCVRRLLRGGAGSLQLEREVVLTFQLSLTLIPLPLLLLPVVVSSRPAGVKLGVEESLFSSHLVVFGLFFFGQ